MVLAEDAEEFARLREVVDATWNGADRRGGGVVVALSVAAAVVSALVGWSSGFTDVWGVISVSVVVLVLLGGLTVVGVRSTRARRSARARLTALMQRAKAEYARQDLEAERQRERDARSSDRHWVPRQNGEPGYFSYW